MKTSKKNIGKKVKGSSVVRSKAAKKSVSGRPRSSSRPRTSRPSGPPRQRSSSGITRRRFVKTAGVGAAAVGAVAAGFGGVAHATGTTTVIGTGDPAQDVPNVQYAVANYNTIYLQGEFDFSNPIIISRPVTIEGIGTISNDGTEVPLSHSAIVPATKIIFSGQIADNPIFVTKSSGITIRNLWMNTNSGGIANDIDPSQGPDPAYGGRGDNNIEDNVVICGDYGIALYNSMCGLNILNNYINLVGRENHEDYPEVASWTAFMVWSDDPTLTTEDTVTVMGNYFRFFRAMFPVEMGGPQFSSRYANFLSNTLTGSASFNNWFVIGQGVLWLPLLIKEEVRVSIINNKFIDLDVPDGPVITVKNSKNCIITKNYFKNLEPQDGAVQVRPGPFGESEDNKILSNDFSESGLTGWTNGGVGCILLTSGSVNNFVKETINSFPPGTTLCDQVLWDADAGLNRIAGWQGVCEHNRERFKEIAERLAALKDEDEPPWGPPQ